MLTGREALRRLDGTINELRRNLSSLDKDLQAVSGRLALNQLDESQILRNLAALRLDSITSNAIDAQLDTVDRDVRQILLQRDSAMEQLNADVKVKEKTLESFEEERVAVHERVDVAANVLAEREAAVQTELANSTEFQKQLEQTQTADAVAISAAEKAAVAAGDRNEKIVPYDSDPLFSYLWRRKYGTSEYKAGLITRMIDRWVARIARYEPARQSYWLLNEIPKRLDQHAAGVRELADAELASLEALEAAAAENGGVVAAQDALRQAETHQDEIDANIESTETLLDTLRQKQGLFASGDDEYLASCIEKLQQALQHRSLDDLTSLARSTMTLEDDQLVDRLRSVRRSQHELKDELDQHRQIHQESLRRMQELSDVRKQFKGRRYDDLRSGFDNGDMILLLIRQVLAGTLRGGTLWDAFRRHQRYRDVAGAWPDFGSGGIGRRSTRPNRPTIKPTWHWPGQKGSNRGFRLPSNRGRSSGSGRSGGRGGFRTGGGF